MAAPIAGLVQPEWLELHLADPDLRVVDASWYLPAERRDGRAEYAQAHLPGAIYLDLSSDLADTGRALRNAIPEPRELQRRFARAGIDERAQVVVYDRRAGYSAGRIWWALRYAGCDRAALLDGGFERWQREGRPLTRDVPSWPPGRFESEPQPGWLRSKDQVLAIVRDGAAVIVDARSPARFRGEGPEPAQRPGHIPGSRNVPHDQNLDGDPPAFRSAAALRALYERAGVDFSRPVVTTCGSGVTAALDAFALTLAGHPDVAVYDGSWDEWGNADDTPVETGDAAER